MGTIGFVVLLEIYNELFIGTGKGRQHGFPSVFQRGAQFDQRGAQFDVYLLGISTEKGVMSNILNRT